MNIQRCPDLSQKKKPASNAPSNGGKCARLSVYVSFERAFFFCVFMPSVFLGGAAIFLADS